MTTQRKVGWVLGSVAVGGALAYGLSRLLTGDRNVLERSSRGQATFGDEPDVYLVLVTENGKKYHLDSCPLLHGETRLIPVSYALEHYEPCKACHPPGDVDALVEEGSGPGITSGE